MLKGKNIVIGLTISALLLGGFSYIGTVYSAQPSTIQERLEGKTAKEKSTIMGQEVAKVDFKGEYTNSLYGVKVDIVQISPINGGIQVFVKAWKNGKQLGFGKDGSVEIERIRMFSVDTVVGTSTNIKAKMRKDIAHTVKVIGKENTKITQGKIGKTSSTFNPASGAVSPVSGLVIRSGVTENWATIRAGAGTNAEDNRTSEGLISTWSGSAFTSLQRLIALFDTSPIGSDTVDSVTLSFDKKIGGGDALIGLGGGSISTSSPASDDALVNADFNIANFGSTKLSDDVYTFDGSSGFFDWTFNASGIDTINTSGLSKYAMRFVDDIDNVGNSPSAGAKNEAKNFNMQATPKLVVEHSPSITAAQLHNAFLYIKDGELRVKDGELRIKSE